MKIIGRMNSRAIMMERFQVLMALLSQKTVTIPRSVWVLYLLFTQPSLIRSFHSSDPYFSMSCPKGVGYARVYCTAATITRHDSARLLGRLVASAKNGITWQESASRRQERRQASRLLIPCRTATIQRKTCTCTWVNCT